MADCVYFYKIQDMGIEIERKFLVTDSSYREMASGFRDIAQGYLSKDPDRTVRIRILDDCGYITVKGRNNGEARKEFEYPVPLKDAMEMLDLCEGRVIRKRRYIVDYRGYRWEVDEFGGDLAPLVVAEIELSECGESFPLPPFVSEDVTGDPTYYNSNLCR